MLTRRPRGILRLQAALRKHGEHQCNPLPITVTTAVTILELVSVIPPLPPTLPPPICLSSLPLSPLCSNSSSWVLSQVWRGHWGSEHFDKWPVSQLGPDSCQVQMGSNKQCDHLVHCGASRPPDRGASRTAASACPPRPRQRVGTLQPGGTEEPGALSSTRLIEHRWLRWGSDGRRELRTWRGHQR